MSEKQKETNSILEELEKFNPVGTKILVEFEISKDNNSKILPCLYILANSPTRVQFNISFNRN